MAKPEERLDELRRLNVGTPVPIPNPTPRERKHAPKWVWPLLAVIVIGFVAASVRGNEPTTVVVADGTVTPSEDLETDRVVPADSYGPIDPTTGDELEVCSWDYCIVHDYLGDARIEQFVYVIELNEATAIADSLTGNLGLPSVDVSSESLAGDLGGYYEPDTASITLDEPIVTWTVIHELAHHIVWERHGAEAWSHGEEFLTTLDSLMEDQ